MPVVLLGTQVSEVCQFHDSGLFYPGEREPAMILCDIGDYHYMQRLKTLSVNIPSSNLLDKTDNFGIVSRENYGQVRCI